MSKKKEFKSQLVIPQVTGFPKPGQVVPDSFGECLSYEEQILRLHKDFEEATAPDVTATGTIINDGGEPEVKVESARTEDGWSFDFQFKNSIGAPGPAATVAVGTTTTGEAGSSASVTNSGTSSAAVLNFTIPKGDKGDAGASGSDGVDGVSPTVSVTDITGGHRITITDKDHPSGQSVDVMDGVDGQNGQDGAAATVAVGTTTTGAAGTNASVTNSGTSSAAVLNFTIPRGAAGQNGTNGVDGVSPTVSVTDITGGHRITITDKDHPSGQSVDVMDGVDGQNGQDGAAATVAVGTTTTGAAGTNASVTNSGTSSAAVLNFTIPRGATGSQGPAGVDGSNIWTASSNPTTPNYTFNISALSGPTGATPRVGDIVVHSYYRYTITSVGSTTVLAGSRTSIRGATGPAGATGAGVAAGGTTGQVLAKASSADYDTTWVNAGGGGGSSSGKGSIATVGVNGNTYEFVDANLPYCTSLTFTEDFVCPAVTVRCGQYRGETVTMLPTAWAVAGRTGSWTGSEWKTGGTFDLLNSSYQVGDPMWMIVYLPCPTNSAQYSRVILPYVVTAAADGSSFSMEYDTNASSTLRTVTTVNTIGG